MSSKYPGGIISKTAPTPSGPYADSTAPGVWTLEQQAYWQKLGQWPTAGNVNPNAFIENLFSTYLYTGNGSTQTITNGIDLSANGGLTWVKQRSATRDNLLFDTVRGATQRLFSNLTSAQSVDASSLTAFNSTGFSIGSDSGVNINAGTYASWTFREQPKFFDVVTWTGDGTGNRSIPHLLGSTPGFIQTKLTSGVDAWWNHHRSVTSPNANWWRNYGLLDGTQAFADWGDNSGLYQAPDATNLYIGSYYNGSGKTYVAYLFAHDAGGFGLTGTDNVISCGSFTCVGNVATVNLGYEPQWIMNKVVDSTGGWLMTDVMRGMPTAGSDNQQLFANTADAEYAGASSVGAHPTATGFTVQGFANKTYIYIAIRRGPMKVPTDGTKVFSPVAQNTGANAVVTTGFPVDLSISDYRSGGGGAYWIDRLRGSTTTSSRSLVSASAGAEYVQTSYGIGLDSNTTIVDNFNNNVISSGPYAYWNFKRAPSFFDEVCYTGNSTAGRAVTHNLTVAPELMIVKRRNDVNDWMVWSSGIPITQQLNLNKDVASFVDDMFYNTLPTVSQFYLTDSNRVNGSGNTYVAYLFATCAGVSKVGSYTGTGAAQTINCGFTGGARFVMIKRTDSTGDWYVWDSARGIIPSNDPYLLLNSTAAEVTGTDYVDTTSVGFDITSTAPAAINANGGTFIFLAIA